MISNGLAFGALLRAHRVGAGLTQFELAERADMSPRAIRALESGRRKAPYRQTVLALTQALRVEPCDLAKFEAAASRARSRPRKGATTCTPGNLALQSTSFVGREELLRDAEAALRSGRFVAFTGRGGVGKSRSATVLAHRLRPLFSGGAWLIDLSSASDEASIVAKIAAILGARLADAETAAAFADCLARRRLLLVFDNCESATTPCATVVAALLERCPSVAVIATSTVRFPGDLGTEMHVSPLPLPPPSGVASFAELRSFDATELFLERCRQYGARYEPCDEIASVVTSVCRRLEGVPLAIELAASRARSLGLHELDRTIGQWFACTRGAFADGPQRHASLFAAIDWSHHLLDDDERRLFRRLSIFRGSFDFAAAEAICADASLDIPSIRTLLSSLAGKSLVTIDAASRCTLFDSLKAYASQKLHEAAEDVELTARHMQYFASFVDDGTEHFYSASGIAWVEAVRREEDNIQSALARAIATGHIALAAHITANLRHYWRQSDRQRESHRLAELLLPQLDEHRHPRPFAELLLIRTHDDFAENGIGNIRHAIAIYARVGDALGQAAANVMLSQCLVETGRVVDALSAIDVAANACQVEGIPVANAYPRLQLSIQLQRGRILFADGKPEARRELVAALELSRASCDTHFMLWSNITLAEYESMCGNLQSAEDYGQENVRVARVLNDVYNEYWGLTNLAAYRIALGKLSEATASLREVFDCEHGYVLMINYAIAHAASIFALDGRAVLAGRLRGYVDHVFGADMTRYKTDQRIYDYLTSEVERRLTPMQRERYAFEGSHLTQAQALEIVRSELRETLSATA